MIVGAWMPDGGGAILGSVISGFLELLLQDSNEIAVQKIKKRFICWFYAAKIHFHKRKTGFFIGFALKNLL